MKSIVYVEMDVHSYNYTVMEEAVLASNPKH